MTEQEIGAEFQVVFRHWLQWKEARRIYRACLVGLLVDLEQDILIEQGVVMG
jgi:hypothetical protein